MRDFFGDASSIVMVLRGYFDDSGDEKQKRFVSVGGLVGNPRQWEHFDKKWCVATYELKQPFHSTDCEAQRGCCEGWTVEKSTALMKELTGVISFARLGAFGAIVPAGEYREIFPESHKYDPYFLALKQTIINMAYICRLAGLQGLADSVVICHEDGETSTEAFQIYKDLKSLATWNDSKYLDGFSVGTKKLAGLQGADLVAREAFKHADNLGVRPLRRSVKAIQKSTSFHLWNRDGLEYLKSKGGPSNLEALTTWGQTGEKAPQIINWFGDGFNQEIPR
jgi:hypothetical protein